MASLWKRDPATRNRTRDHLIPACNYSQVLYQLSYCRAELLSKRENKCDSLHSANCVGIWAHPLAAARRARAWDRGQSAGGLTVSSVGRSASQLLALASSSAACQQVRLLLESTSRSQRSHPRSGRVTLRRRADSATETCCFARAAAPNQHANKRAHRPDALTVNETL